MKQQYLFIFQSSPYENLNIQDALEMITALVAFEQTVTVVLIADGYYATLPAQASTQSMQPHKRKLIYKLLQALRYQDIQPIYVIPTQGHQFEFQAQDNYQIITPSALNQLIAKHDHHWII